MKSERLFGAIGEIDEKLIWDAVNDKASDKKTLNTNSCRLKWAFASLGVLAAAVVILVIIHGVSVLNKNLGKSLPQLPKLTVAEETPEAMGYEGYMAYEISELVNANPWSEDAKLSNLPVYRNCLSYDKYNIVSGADFEAMKQFLTEIAGRLNMDTESLKITDDTPSEEYKAAVLEKADGEIPEGYFDPTKVTAEQNGIKIQVDVSMTAEIFFKTPVPLPDGYNFSNYSSYEDSLAAAKYLKKTYRNLIGMDNPQISVSGGDYNIYLKQGYHIEFYNKNGDLAEDILDYNFNRAAFYCNDNGELYMVRIFNPNLSDKTGDYPVISASEAETLLLNGNYITTVPYEIAGKEYISKTELVYRTGTYEKYYMPYYRFYVELPEIQRENGIKDYGAYYVPAVRSEYIENMP